MRNVNVFPKGHPVPRLRQTRNGLPNILQCADHRSDAGATRKGAAGASCDDVLSDQEAALAKIEPPNISKPRADGVALKPLPGI